MIKFYYKPPKFIKKIYPNTIWDSAEDKILLSFDDGPTPKVTQMVLRKLNDYKLKSIFFCTGINVERYGNLLKETADEGHTIAAHSWNHQKYTNFTKYEISEDILKCKEIISNQIGIKIKYFRPPYGRIFPLQAKYLSKAGLTNVMWSLVTYDYESDFRKVNFAIDNYLSKNSIVVFHDSSKTEKIIEQSIDYLLNSVNKNGFIIGTPAQCLK